MGNQILFLADLALGLLCMFRACVGTEDWPILGAAAILLLFHAMKETAYLINVSRGAVIREQALIVALKEGDLAGAALDVFEHEPLPPDSEL